jgi:hypothetical protein
MELIKKINEQLEAFKAKRIDLVKQLQAEFPSLLAPLFAESKRIESIGWRQYTPYFNDGDECVFGVHNDDLTINGTDDYDGDENEIAFIKEKTWDGKKWVVNTELDTHEFKILKQIQKVLRSIPDDFYKDLFGDHVKVTIYKDGRIETDEYEHD